jgi:hypothetical protein
MQNSNALSKPGMRLLGQVGLWHPCGIWGLFTPRTHRKQAFTLRIRINLDTPEHPAQHPYDIDNCPLDLRSQRFSVIQPLFYQRQYGLSTLSRDHSNDNLNPPASDSRIPSPLPTTLNQAFQARLSRFSGMFAG